MTDKIDNKYYVEAVQRSSYYSDRHATIAEAEAAARKQTHKNGESYGIFVMTHQTKVPEIVHNVQIETVQ